jgi:hypothetical protein
MAFSDLRKMRERLEAVPQLIETLIGDAIAEYHEEIADLNVEQLEQGETADATPIRPAYRNPNYARLKNARNAKPGFGTPDLIDKKDFANSIRVDAYATYFETRATDRKAADLIKKYGRVIGINTMNQQRIQNEILKPYLSKKLRLVL